MCSFTLVFFFFFNSQSHGGCYGILKLKKYFLFEKSVCYTSKWMTHEMSFNGQTRHLSSCYWKCYHVLFLLMWRVAADDRWFVASYHFFLLLSFLYVLEKVHVCPLFFWFFNFSPYVFLLHISVIDSFIKKFMFLI